MHRRIRGSWILVTMKTPTPKTSNISCLQEVHAILVEPGEESFRDRCDALNDSLEMQRGDARESSLTSSSTTLKTVMDDGESALDMIWVEQCQSHGVRSRLRNREASQCVCTNLRQFLTKTPDATLSVDREGFFDTRHHRSVHARTYR